MRSKPSVLLWLISAFVSCQNTPTGPSVDPEPRLGLFTVLTPDAQVQTVTVNRSVGIRGTADPAIDQATLSLRGGNNRFTVHAMPVGLTAPDTLSGLPISTDFISHRKDFNYILAHDSIRAGEQYTLEASHPGYGSVAGTTRIPGAFALGEIRDIDLVRQSPDYRQDLIVEWSTSAHAGGYLVDISFITWDLSQWSVETELEDGTFIHTTALRNAAGHFESHHPSAYKYLEQIPVFSRDTLLFDIPYTETPVTLTASGTNRYRGVLTQSTRFQLSIEELLKKIEFDPQDLITSSKNFYGFRIAVHALDEHLYRYLAVQYQNSGSGEIIGQQAVLSDYGNIDKGVGLVGSAHTRQKTIRLWNLKVDGLFTYKDLFRKDTLASPACLESDLSNMAFGHKTTLKWRSTRYADSYLVVLKPRSLFFESANMRYLVQDTILTLDFTDLPFRDTRIDWYVKAFSSWPENYGLVEVPRHKGFLLLNGFYLCHYVELENRVLSGGGTVGFNLRPESPWSETATFTLENNPVPGFDSLRPEPQAKDSKTLHWPAVMGADVYLIRVAESGSTDYRITACHESGITFPHVTPFAFEGLDSAVTLANGHRYDIRVCALRLQTGSLGFAVGRSSGEELPRVYPRYAFPSGIMLRSEWSENLTFEFQP